MTDRCSTCSAPLAWVTRQGQPATTCARPACSGHQDSTTAASAPAVSRARTTSTAAGLAVGVDAAADRAATATNQPKGTDHA
jgi:hypothetical protein